MMRWLHRDEEDEAGRGALARLIDRINLLREQLEAQGWVRDSSSSSEQWCVCMLVFSYRPLLLLAGLAARPHGTFKGQLEAQGWVWGG